MQLRTASWTACLSSRVASRAYPDYFKDAEPIRAFIEAKLGKDFELAKDAVLRSGQAGVTPSCMQVEQGMFYKPLTWMVYLNGTKRFYVYDKTGKLLHEKN